jgi:hypothetical protein
MKLAEHPGERGLATLVRSGHHDHPFRPVQVKVVAYDGPVIVGQLGREPAHTADNAAEQAPVATVSEDQPRMPGAGTKLVQLVALLDREEDATVGEIAATLGWQAHTARGVMSGSLTKRFTLKIVSEVVDDGTAFIGSDSSILTPKE